MPLLNSFLQFEGLRGRYVFLLLAVLGFLAYANAIHHPFVHDDVVFIKENPYLADLNLKDFFLQTSVPDSRFPLVNQYYRPFLEFLNRLLYKVFGRNPHGFHFFNVLVHILNSFLVYRVIGRVADRHQGMALAGALVFLVHPVQSEAVACVSGISNLVLTFFCLVTVLSYLKAVQLGEREQDRPVFYAGALAAFFLGLLSKEQAVILPFLLVAHELCFAPRIFRPAVRSWFAVAGFFVVLAGYFLLRQALFGFALTPVMDSPGELWLRILSIPRSLLIYFGLMFFPRGLHYYRSQDILLPWAIPMAGLAVLVAGLGFLIWRTPPPERRWMLFGLGWFMVALLPMLNIVPLINEYSQILTAEHFLYLPIIGMVLFVFAVCHYWLAARSRSFVLSSAKLLLAVLLIFFAGMTVRQNAYWRGEIPLFERTLQYQPKFGRVYALLAGAYASEGRFQDAVAADRKALGIMQGYADKVDDPTIKDFYLNFIKGIRYHLGYCLDALGDPQASLMEFKEALRLAPRDPAIHYMVGMGFLKIHDIENAVRHFEQALALNPEDLRTVNSLAVCYQEIGQDAKAEEFLRVIVERDPSSVSAKQNLENFLHRSRLKDSQENF